MLGNAQRLRSVPFRPEGCKGHTHNSLRPYRAPICKNQLGLIRPYVNTAARRSSLPDRINRSSFSSGLSHTRLGHLLFHFADDGFAERFLFLAGGHNTVIMSRVER